MSMRHSAIGGLLWLMALSWGLSVREASSGMLSAGRSRSGLWSGFIGRAINRAPADQRWFYVGERTDAASCHRPPQFGLERPEHVGNAVGFHGGAPVPCWGA